MAELLHIVLACSPAPRIVHEFPLQVTAGTTVAQAIALWQASHPASADAFDVSKARYGVWGKRAKPNQVLKLADRLEIYRPLQADPQTARRERFAKQGAKKGSKGAGLFSQTRVGGKKGY